MKTKFHVLGCARYWYDRRRWHSQEIDAHGNALTFAHLCQSRQEAEASAARINKRRAEQLREFPAQSSESLPHYHSAAPASGVRPSRSPYFYREQAIIWGREARRPYGLLHEDGGAARLAKSYLASYRKALAEWKARYGV